jgi:hypothetical protein
MLQAQYDNFSLSYRASERGSVADPRWPAAHVRFFFPAAEEKATIRSYQSVKLID